MVHQPYEAQGAKRYNYAYYLIQIVSFAKEMNFIYSSDRWPLEDIEVKAIKKLLKDRVGSIEFFSAVKLEGWEKDQFVSHGVPNIMMLTTREIFCLTA